MTYKILAFLCIFFIAQKCFADMNVYVRGMIVSYKKGIYTVKVDKEPEFTLIRASELSAELKERLNRKIGRRIQIGIPSDAISIKSASRKSASESKRAQK